MTRIFNDLLAPPTFADEDRNRTARLFHTYLLLDAAVSIVLAIILQVFAPKQMSIALINLVLVFIAMAAVKRGYIRAVGIVALGAIVGVFYLSNFVTHTPFGPGTAYSLIFLAVAAFVFGRRGLWVTLTLSAALVIGAAYSAYSATRVKAEQSVLFFDAVTYLFIFMLFSFTIAVATDFLSAALTRAKTSERALRETNAALEQRIAERTQQLTESEWHYRSLIENTSDMISILWPNGEIVYESPSIEPMLGYKPEQVLGGNVYRVIHPDDVPKIKWVAQDMFSPDSKSPGRVFEARFLHAQGHWVHLEMTGKVMQEGRFPGSIVIASRDITERKQAERIIQRQTESERIVADISDWFTRMAPGQLDETINQALQKLGKFVQADVCRLFLLEEYSSTENRLTNSHEWLAPGITSELDSVLYHNFYRKFDWWHQQMLAYNIIHMFSLEELPPSLDLFRSELQRRKVRSLLTVPLMHNGQLMGELGLDAIREPHYWSPDDIRLLRVVSEMIVNVLERERVAAALQAERNQLEARVAQRTAELSQLLTENARLHEHEVQAAALAERSRLARELHDSVSQALFGIVLGSRTLMQKASNAPELVEPMSYVLHQAEAALAEMRALIFELRPESLEQEGLIAAFHKQAEALCARHQIEVTTHLGQVEPELPIEAKEALYRIGLEAIQNTIKHARAKRVELNLSVSDKRVSLEVCDDGIGFDTNLHYPGHLGLVSMRERAEKCGGSLEIGSHQGHGTAIRVQLPTDCACH
jgi:PAS domain S-box-containing protein